MKAGAADVIEAPYNECTIIAAIEGALQLGQWAQKYTAEMQAGRDLAAMLTPRERHVLDQIAKGRSNKVAAFELGISARTIEFHRARIMEKLNAQHCSDLVRAALAIERAADAGPVFRI
jgi:two-component system response regulator FixJ